MPKLAGSRWRGGFSVREFGALVIVGLFLVAGVLASPPSPAHASLQAAPVTSTASVGAVALSTNPLWRSWGETVAREAPSMISKLLQPHATTPSLNITGFGILAEGTNALSNNGVNFTSNIPPLPPGFSGGTTSFVIAVCGETVTTNVSAVVGYAETSLLGATAALPVYAVNDSGTSIEGSAPITDIMSVGPTLHTFDMVEDHGPWWKFTADGNLIGGGLVGSGNGTADLQVDNASLLDLAIPVFGYLIPANVSGMPLASIHQVLDVRSGSTWTPPIEGLEAFDENLGLAGYLQDSTIPPDSVNFGGSYATLGLANLLWDTAALPHLTVSVTGFPSTLSSGQTVKFPAWVNSSGSAEAGATLAGTDPLGGVTTVVGAGTTPGEQWLSYTAPRVTQNEKDNLSVTASETGYVGARDILPFNVGPAGFVLGLPSKSPSVYSQGSLVVPLRVNTSYGTVDTGANVTAWTGGIANPGNVSVAPTLGPFDLDYSAPTVETNQSVRITVEVTDTGFVPSWANITVYVLPRTITLAASPFPWLAPGQSVNWAWTASGAGLGPGPLANLTWSWASLAVGASSVLQIGKPYIEAGGITEVTITASASYLGPVTLWTNVTCPGYAPASWVSTFTVMGNLTVHASAFPGNLSGGSSTTLHVQVTGLQGAAVPDIAVVWTTSEGTFTGGSASVVTYTDASGDTSITLSVPNGNGNLAVRVTVNATEPGYRSGDLVLTSTDRPNLANTLTTGATPWVIFGVILLLVALTAFFLGGRRRRQNESISSRTKPKKKTEEEEEPATWAPGPEEDKTVKAPPEATTVKPSSKKESEKAPPEKDDVTSPSSPAKVDAPSEKPEATPTPEVAPATDAKST